MGGTPINQTIIDKALAHEHANDLGIARLSAKRE
jgi:hypothetical protein